MGKHLGKHWGNITPLNTELNVTKRKNAFIRKITQFPLFIGTAAISRRSSLISFVIPLGLEHST